MHEHIRRAHLQANIWSQDIVQNPNTLDATALGWKVDSDRLMSVLSRESVTPDSIMDQVKCGCRISKRTGDKCSQSCSCKKHNLRCSESCSCKGEEEICANMSVSQCDDDESDDGF